MSHPRKLLSAWLDGELSGPRADDLRRHLASCPRCRRELRALRGLAGLLAGSERALPGEPEPSARLLRRLEAAVAATPPRLPPGPADARELAGARGLALAALLALVLLAGGLGAGWYVGARVPAALAADVADVAADGSDAADGAGAAAWPDGAVLAEGETLGGAYQELLAMEVEP